MKKVLFLAAGAAMATSSAVFAADAVETIPEAPIAIETPVVFSWSGPYLGVHGGYGWGNAELDGIGDQDFNGGRFGGFAGYNWQVSDGFVAGIEGDLNYDWNEENIGAGLDGKTGLSGGIRARAGFAFDRALLYAAGGWTATNVEVSGAIDDDDTLHGWTIGAGLDYAFTDNMFGRAEYRYNDYGSGDVLGTDVDFNQHVFQVGLGVKF